MTSTTPSTKPIRVCWRERRAPEQIEWPEDWDVQYGNVKTGDINCGDLCIELKHSVADLIGSFVGQRKKRFWNQGDRMTEFERRFVLIRPTKEEVEQGIKHSRLPGWVCLKNLYQWCREFEVVPIFNARDKDVHLLIQQEAA